MRWHHAREDFAAKVILGKIPEVKGAYVHCNDGSRVWCVWSRFFGNNSKDSNTLVILRLVIEGEEDLNPSSRVTKQDTYIKSLDENKIHAVAVVLRAAQIEASQWDMNEVQVWNPTSLTIGAAQEILPSVEVIHRDEDSIASLRWHGSGDASNVEWLGNEKYGWC